MPISIPEELESRIAMRAYLQRAEVRLSTIHRVAGAFLSGAGILFLFPILFKDAIVGLVIECLKNGYWEALIMIFFSNFVVISSFYLLIRDLMLFYITPRQVGMPKNPVFPRFILSGISISQDEIGAKIREDINYIQTREDMLDFLLANDISESLPEESMNELIQGFRPDILKLSHDQYEESRFRRFLSDFRLSGVIDQRYTYEDVAKMEISLVKHTIQLRRLIIRYFKAVLLSFFSIIIFYSAFSLVESDIPNIEKNRESIILISLFIWTFFCTYSY
jgi:hypothetical protein